MGVSTAAAAGRSVWQPALVTAGAGLGLLAVLFMPEIRAAATVWAESTAFGHCYLVLPIAGWLAWERRALLTGLVPRPLPAAALLVLPCALAWLVAERLGLMEGRQLAALGMLWVLVLACFGTRVTAAMAAPLAYLVFLVPFGAFLVPALQSFTAAFIETGLNLLAIPHYVDQIVIEIPEGRFLVAEACAGLRFLIAAIAFGALYALLIYRSPWRRLAFVAVSIVVPILANGVRALGIVVLGHVLGSAQAGAVDHVLYGWLFFSLVIVLLIVMGLPFREDREAFTAPTLTVDRASPARGAMTGLAVVCVLLLSGLGPAVALALDRRGAAVEPLAADQSVTLPGCQAVARSSASDQTFACQAGVFVRMRRFGPRAGAGLVQAELQAGDRTMDGDEVDHATLSVPDGTWRLSSMREPSRAAASAVWMAGRPSAGGLRDRLALALASLGLTDTNMSPTVMTVSDNGPGAERAVRAFVRDAALPTPR